MRVLAKIWSPVTKAASYTRFEWRPQLGSSCDRIINIGLVFMELLLLALQLF